MASKLSVVLLAITLSCGCMVDKEKEHADKKDLASRPFRLQLLVRVRSK